MWENSWRSLPWARGWSKFIFWSPLASVTLWFWKMSSLGLPTLAHLPGVASFDISPLVLPPTKQITACWILMLALPTKNSSCLRRPTRCWTWESCWRTTQNPAKDSTTGHSSCAPAAYARAAITGRLRFQTHGCVWESPTVTSIELRKLACCTCLAGIAIHGAWSGTHWSTLSGTTIFRLWCMAATIRQLESY